MIFRLKIGMNNVLEEKKEKEKRKEMLWAFLMIYARTMLIISSRPVSSFN